jgi:hypothetical protein
MDEPYQASPDVYVLPTHLPIPGLGNLIINAYLIKSEEPVLIDTGVIGSPLDPDESAHFIAAVDAIVPLRDLRWIWLTHDDMDHAGSLPRIMELAPQARLATHAFSALRMASWWPVPLDRVHAMRFGDRLDVGDRTLRAVAPPTFDNPTSTGLLDEKTATLFSVDCFGAILPEVATDCAVISPDVVRQGMTAWLTMDSPWTQLIDREKWDAVLDGIRRMAPNMIMSSHLPAATGTCETFLDIVRALPDVEHMPAPDNEQFQQMLAMMGPPPGANRTPAPAPAAVAAAAGA